MTPEQYVQRLTDISDKKYKLLQDMLLLTVEQSKTIHEDGIEQLDSTIAAKQSIIEQIDKLDNEFGACFQGLKQELKIKSLDEIKSPAISGVKELKDSVRHVMDLIRKIADVDKQNNDKAKQLLDELGNEIRKINQGKKVNAAYKPAPNVQPPAYYFDRKK